MVLPEISIQISANSVAWYGAILATLGASVSLYNLWKDRGRIKITYQKNMQVRNAVPPFTEGEVYFIVNVINKGRRPLVIGTVAMQYVTGENFILNDCINSQVNRILTEENPHTMYTIDQNFIDFSKIYRIMVYDKLGREYVSYFSKVPTFVKIVFKVRSLFIKT